MTSWCARIVGWCAGTAGVFGNYGLYMKKEIYYGQGAERNPNS